MKIKIYQIIHRCFDDEINEERPVENVVATLFAKRDAFNYLKEISDNEGRTFNINAEDNKDLLTPCKEEKIFDPLKEQTIVVYGVFGQRYGYDYYSGSWYIKEKIIEAEEA